MAVDENGLMTNIWIYNPNCGHHLAAVVIGMLKYNPHNCNAQWVRGGKKGTNISIFTTKGAYLYIYTYICI
jgi:hypothetical protein